MLNLLKNSEVFDHLEGNELNYLFNQIQYQIHRYKRSDIIYDNIRFKKKIGVVLRGKIEVQKNMATGKLIIMSLLKPGDIFGMAAVFHERDCYAVSLLVKTETTVLFIAEYDLLKLFQLDQMILRKYLSYVNKRIYYLNYRIECFAQEPIHERVLYYLQQLESDEKKKQGGVQNLSKSELANFLGISRPSLYRVLRDLKDQGLIMIQKNKIGVKKT